MFRQCAGVYWRERERETCCGGDVSVQTVCRCLLERQREMCCGGDVSVQTVCRCLLERQRETCCGGDVSVQTVCRCLLERQRETCCGGDVSVQRGDVAAAEQVTVEQPLLTARLQLPAAGPRKTRSVSICASATLTAAATARRQCQQHGRH